MIDIKVTNPAHKINSSNIILFAPGVAWNGRELAEDLPVIMGDGFCRSYFWRDTSNARCDEIP
jgi:hypothetical protein